MREVIVYAKKKITLSDAGIHTIECNSMIEVISVLKDRRIDVVVIDYGELFALDYLLDLLQENKNQKSQFEIIVLAQVISKDEKEFFRFNGITHAIEYSKIDSLSTVIRFMEVKEKAPVRIQKLKIPTIKRVFDIVSASIALLLLSPLLITIIILIKLESKGPVFYAAKRVGAKYKVFDFYKLRSMRVDADQMLDKMKDLNQYTEGVEPKSSHYYCTQCLSEGDGCRNILYKDGKSVCEFNYLQEKAQETDNAFIKIKDDPRITRVGQFIRRTSIDELPQLINIIKGDMSVVGNRPLPLYEAEQLTSDKYAKRFLAPAGLTGLWQVSKRGQSDMSSDERKMLDNEYADNFSFLGDLGIILRTIPALFQKENV